ncbi:TetR family transcriptional regulator [Nocardia sp. ET3-3]|uniref:TetR family transcriptional regulator n=1 Tax=Nocardia terrae TaxID=2675851 RepID=A0A7K1V2K9_9NOCA|nr:TetR/AcrR family transcriptional regulator [Nocardia terrae]MVU80679.1 TetR family transcriptional regulator [Nocardia terrae]
MGDARTDRWSGHREEMRRQLVAAAIRAIERVGPQVSMSEIASEARVPKPTIYRFFKDKSALAGAIAERARGDVGAALADARRRSPGTVGELVHTALTGYAALLVGHPNVARFLFMGDNPGVQATENWQSAAQDVAVMIATIIEESGGAEAEVMLHSSMIVGAVTGAAVGWFSGAESAGTASAFVARVEPAVRALIQLAAAEASTVIDFDLSIRAPVSR